MTSDPVPAPNDDVLDLLVIGGGVMGLFTAYYGVTQGDRVAVIEKGRIGDPATASYGRTRSYRRDYLDAAYTRFADEAISLWNRFEAATGARALVRCGCMNISKDSVTPDTDATYAAMSTAVLQRMGLPVTSYPNAAAVQARFPYLRADLADLDVTGGLVDLAAVAAALTATLAEAKAGVHEQVTTTGIDQLADGTIRVTTDLGVFLARSLVITAGHGTNDVLRLLPGSTLQIPITKDRPSEARYYTPPAETRGQFTSDAMPVIAYLDTGIYLHPIVEGVVDAVKIGYYNPPDMPRDSTSIDSIAAFIDQCFPGLAGCESVEVSDVDQCDYDLVADDDFVLGGVPGFTNVFVGVGWRGTGYKYSPWVGRVLHELARHEGTVYDIARFAPARFDTAGSPAAGAPSS